MDRPLRAFTLAALLTLAPLLAAAPVEGSPCLENMQMAAATTTSDCRGPGTGSGSSNDGPATTWYQYGTTAIRDTEDPLVRFTVFPIADNVDGHPDRVVDIPPMAVPADRGNLTTALTAITNADIVAAMAYFTLDAQFIEDHVVKMLPGEEYAAVREAARDAIDDGEFRHAVDVIMSQATPMDVSLWCGDDWNPVELRWVLAVPLTMPCPVRNEPKEIRAVVSSPDDAAFIAANLHLGRANVINFTYTADGSLLNVGKALAGFTYGAWGVGAHVQQNKRWTAHFTGDNLFMHDGNTAIDARWTAAAGSSLQVDERFYLTSGAKLSRGTSFVWNLTSAVYEFPKVKVQFPQTYWTDQAMIEVTPPTSRPFKTTGFHSELAPGVFAYTEVHVNAARWPSAPLFHGRVNPKGGGLEIALAKPAHTVADLPNDTWEAKTTLFAAGQPLSSLQLLGGPSRISMHLVPISGDLAGRVDAASNVSGAPAFRTIVATSYEANLSGGNSNDSLTSNYALRSMIQLHPTFDPQGCVNGQFLLYGTRLTTDEGHTVARAGEDPVGTYIQMRKHRDPETQRDGIAWRLAGGPEQHTPDASVGSPSEQPSTADLYVWALHPSQAFSPSVVPASPCAG